MPATLKSRLPEIAAEIRPRVSAAVKDSAQAIAKAAAARAPVDTGALKRAIHVERRGAAEYAVVAGDGDEVRYGHLVEFGTAAGKNHHPTSPKPFLVPAAEAERLPTEQRIQRALGGH